MTLEEFAEGQTVFKHEDIGDKFYIILEGSVSAHVPEITKVPAEVQQQNKLQCEHLQNVIRIQNGKINRLMERAEKIKAIKEVLNGELKLVDDIEQR